MMITENAFREITRTGIYIIMNTKMDTSFLTHKLKK